MSRFILLSLVAGVGLVGGCQKRIEVQGVSGTKMATVGQVETTPEGLTVEQKNIVDRIKADNEVGGLKHLYVISAYSGQVILYSPVRGKVTSGGKRLTPRVIQPDGGSPDLPQITVGGRPYAVSELPGEDGAYGQSGEYLFWFTPDGRYFQFYVTGGMSVVVADQPLTVKGVVITVDPK